MITGIFAIIVGFALLTAFLVLYELIPIGGQSLDEEVERIGIFQGAIGIIGVGIGVWGLGIWISIILIIAGVTAALGLLMWAPMPKIKQNLDKLIKGLVPVQMIIGVLSINAGILALLG